MMCCHFLVSCPATSLQARAPLLVCARVLNSMYQPLPPCFQKEEFVLYGGSLSCSPLNSPALPPSPARALVG